MSKPEEISKSEYHVYGIFNHSNGKAYIGLAAKPLKQAKDHLAKKGNRLIGEDLETYPRSHFAVEVLYSTDDKKEAASKHKALILQHGSLFPTGYNLTLGGKGSQDHMWSAQQKQKVTGSNNARAKLTNVQVTRILCDKRTRREIAKEYGVSETTVSDIKSRRKWTHVPLPTGYTPLTKKRRTS